MSTDDDDLTPPDKGFRRDSDERPEGPRKIGEAEVPSRLHDDQLRLIGRIAVGFSLLELATQILLFSLIHPDTERGVAVVGGDDIGTQLSRIGRLAKVNRDVDEATRRDVLAWVQRVGEVKDERNRVLHGVWVGAPNLERVLTFSFRRGRSKFAEYTTSDLDDLAAIYDTLSVAGFELVARVRGGEPPTEIDANELD